MNLRKRGRVLLRKTHEVGPVYTAQLLLARLLPAWALSVHRLFVVKVDLHPWKDYRTEDREVRWGGLEDLDLLIATGATENVRGWFEHGGRVAVIERAGRVLAYYVVRVKHHDQCNWLRINLPPADIWTHMAWVAPEWRGRGLYPIVRSFALSEYANAGYNRLFAIIDVLNRNSIRASSKRGSVILGRMGFVRVLGFTVVYFGRSVRLGWWGRGRRLTLSSDQLEKMLNASQKVASADGS